MSFVWIALICVGVLTLCVRLDRLTNQSNGGQQSTP